MSLPPKIVLHLGPHKTATTHLQRTLEGYDPELALFGVQFFGPKLLRRKGRNIPALFSLTRPSVATEKMPVHRLLRNNLARLVLSDENFLGALHDGEGHVPLPVYDGAADRVEAMVGRVGHGRLTVCLAVRQPASFLISTYTQVLVSGRKVEPEKFAADNPVDGVDWVPLVKSISEIEGLAGVTIWPYENYGDLQPQILREMIGDPAPKIVMRSDTVNLGLSARAVKIICEAPDGADISALTTQTRRLFPSGPDNPKPKLYDADALARADSNYADQLMQIGRMAGVKLLEPRKSA